MELSLAKKMVVEQKFALEEFTFLYLELKLFTKQTIKNMLIAIRVLYNKSRVDERRSK